MAASAPGCIDPNFKNPNGDGDTSVIIYGYTPALVLGVLGSVLFGIYGIAAIVLSMRLRRAGAILTAIGAAFETVGYICRSLSAKVDPYFLSYFVTQYFFIVVAPVFFAAVIYLTLSRLIAGVLVADDRPPVSTRAILIIFVIFDIVTTIIQIAGAASIGSAESNGQDPTPANNVLITGLAIQTAAFLVFIIIYAVTVTRLVVRSKAFPPQRYAAFWDARWLFGLLFVVAILVQLRTAFRLGESSQGVNGYLSSHEVYFGCLEFLPIVLAVAGLLLLEWAFKRPCGAFAAVGSSGQSLRHPAEAKDLESSQPPREDDNKSPA